QFGPVQQDLFRLRSRYQKGWPPAKAGAVRLQFDPARTQVRQQGLGCRHCHSPQPSSDGLSETAPTDTSSVVSGRPNSPTLPFFSGIWGVLWTVSSSSVSSPGACPDSFSPSVSSSVSPGSVPPDAARASGETCSTSRRSPWSTRRTVNFCRRSSLLSRRPF